MLAFLLEAVLVSLSGVMAPGPLSAATVARGSESPHAGAVVAIGHAIVELPLMACILLGLGFLLEQIYVRVAMALVGGLFLSVMGVGMLRSIKRTEFGASKNTHSSMVAGIVLSAGNPYFLVWWATVGATLISRSARFGMLGFVSLALLHWLCDLVWLYLLSGLSFKGKKLLGKGFQRAVLAISGALLLFFGARFIIGSIGDLLARPFAFRSQVLDLRQTTGLACILFGSNIVS